MTNKTAIFGATGLVGSKILEVLSELNFPFDELILVSSPRSAGKEISFNNKLIKVVTPETALNMKPNLVLMSAGSGPSKIWAPQFEKAGAWVIDNSSAWRMDSDIPLLIPPINGQSLKKYERRIIANPNCSTIQMLVALHPLHTQFKLKELVVSTYQSVTGTGIAAVEQLMAERNGNSSEHPAYPHPIDLNLIPHIDVFLDNGFTKEEMKMVHETHKIMEDSSIMVSPTAVRVPVLGGHSESIRATFERDITPEAAKKVWSETEGIVLMDDPNSNLYPMPILSKDKNEVFIGRVRQDLWRKDTLNMWVVADNLRIGAATNAVNIALMLKKDGLI